VREILRIIQVVLSPATDARKKEALAIWQPSLSTLLKQGGRRVVITPLGDIVDAHD
jgi:hypothetical protein